MSGLPSQYNLPPPMHASFDQGIGATAASSTGSWPSAVSSPYPARTSTPPPPVPPKYGYVVPPRALLASPHAPPVPPPAARIAPVPQAHGRQRAPPQHSPPQESPDRPVPGAFHWSQSPVYEQRFDAQEPPSPVDLPDRPPSSASSGGFVEAATSSRTSGPTTPRKRVVGKTPRPPRAYSSPRAAQPQPPRKREGKGTERRVRDAAGARPTLSSTLSYLMIPVRLMAIILAPLRPILSPVLWHVVNAFLLAVFSAILVYSAVHYVKHSIFGLAASSSTAISTAVLLPLRLVATPTCLVANFLCPHSLLTGNNETAQPFWRVMAPERELDVAAVSHVLSKGVRNAQDIFESLQSLGDGRLTQGLNHVRVHELGIAIQFGSTLDDRLFLSEGLVELADLASKITDEVALINAMSVSIFSWLFWDFSQLVRLLAPGEDGKPHSSKKISSRLDSLIARLDSDLDRLSVRVGSAIPVAERGSEQGWKLHTHLSEVESDLQTEKAKFPTWQRALDASRHFFVGGDPSKLARISNDLSLTRDTISEIGRTRDGLLRVRMELIVFRDQVRHFSGSIMGLHLGASEAAGLGPAEEIGILNDVVNELGAAVGRAKRLPGGRELGIAAP